MSKLNLLDAFKKTDNKYSVANDIVRTMNKESAYDLATSLLSVLEDMGYCIWQTYTKEDIKSNTGKSRITKEYMQELGYSLQSFENIRIY